MGNVRILLLPLLVLLLTGCSGSDPWAETELSRDVRAWRGTMMANLDLGEMEKHFGFRGLLRPKPNLYDLHHPDGALAVGQQKHGLLAIRILEKAGLPVELDTETGTVSYDGELRQLWLRDKVRLDLPASRVRASLPPGGALLSMTSVGQVRATAGDEWSTPIRVDEVTSFVHHWASQVGLEPFEGRRSRPVADEVSVFFSDTGCRIDDTATFPTDQLLGKIRPILDADPDTVIRLEPDASARYGDFVAVLDQLYRALGQGDSEIRFTLPGREGRELRIEHLEKPVLVLKIDSGLAFADLDKVLDRLASRLDEIVLLTHLDVSDPSAVTPETYPGGLPGGLVLPLAPRPAAAIVDEESETASSPEGPIHVGGDVRAPEKIYAPNAVYTEVARKARVQGVVIAQLIIDREGKVTNVKILKDLPMGLGENAVEAFRQWTFQPATLNGRPVAVYYNVTMNFRLQ